MQQIIFKIFVALFYFSSTDCRAYRYDYKYAPQVEGWLKVHEIPATWHDARLRCKLEGANLASPTNLQLLEMLKFIALSKFPCGIFTGVHATFSKGDYFSVEGIPLGRMPIEWSSNEPDNYENSEECLIVQSNGTLADVKCTDLFPYVCYKKGSDSVSLNDCGTTDPEYVYEQRTNSCYKFHFVGRPFSRAFMACTAEGAYLAIINSETEAEVIRELFAKHPDSTISGDIKGIAFLGFHNWGEKLVWTTIHGQSIQEAGYAKFEKNQPDNRRDGVYCGAIFRSGFYDDLQCDKNAPFICEKSPESLISI